MSPAKKQRIFLVGEQPVCRHGMAQIINDEADLVVCGETSSPAQALPSARSAKADVLVLDLSTKAAAPDFIKQARTELPNLRVLVISAEDESPYVLGLLRAGAQGYVMKSEGLNDFLGAIRKVLGGELYLNRSFGEQLISDLARGNEPAPDVSLDRLTNREREVLKLIGAGRSNRDIARELKLSPKTVETHRLHIREKLGLSTSTELMRFALTAHAEG